MHAAVDYVLRRYLVSQPRLCCRVRFGAQQASLQKQGGALGGNGSGELKREGGPSGSLAKVGARLQDTQPECVCSMTHSTRKL